MSQPPSLLACVILEGRAKVGRSPVILSRCVHNARNPWRDAQLTFYPQKTLQTAHHCFATFASDSTSVPIFTSDLLKTRFIHMPGKLGTAVSLAAVLVAVCFLLVPTDATCVLPVSPFQVRSGTPADHELRHPGDPNYKNVKAVDLAVRTAGQAVYAVETGRLSKGGSFAISSGSSSKWGWSFEVITPDNRHFFYTHVANPLANDPSTGRPWGPGAAVTQGQLLGWVAQPPAGKPAHLHFAHKEGNPCAYLRGCRGKGGAAPDNLPC